MNYSPMPLRIDTERLVLTPEEENDAGWFTELLNARDSDTFTTEDACEQIAAMTATIEAFGVGAPVLRSRPHGDPLGYTAIVIGLGSIDEPKLAYGTPAADTRAGIRHRSLGRTAGGRLWVRRIWSTVRSWSAPSFRVLEKLGFRRDHSATDADGELVWLV